MAMLSLSEQCVLQHHHLHDGRPPTSSHPPLLRPHQLKLSLRDVLQDVYNCELIQRSIVEPLCQVVLRVEDVNRSNSSYEKAFGMRLLRTCTYSDYKAAFGTNILYKTAEAFWDIHGQSTLRQPRSNARIFASLDSDDGKADGARKALEQAFQGKKNIAKKWEEEIRKRELSGGDGGSSSGSGGGGGSWGGGGGDEEMGEGFGQDEPWDWEEFGQTFMATFALIILYISITHGPKQVLKKFKLLFRYIRQGFRLRKIPDEYLQGSDDDSDEDYKGDSDDEARDEIIRNRRAELSTSNAREGDVQNNNSVNDSVNDETEDDEDDDMFDAPTTPKQQAKRADLLSKRQAEQKEKLLQLLTPKERRQQEEKK